MKKTQNLSPWDICRKGTSKGYISGKGKWILKVWDARKIVWVAVRNVYIKRHLSLYTIFKND